MNRFEHCLQQADIEKQRKAQRVKVRDMLDVWLYGNPLRKVENKVIPRSYAYAFYDLPNPQIQAWAVSRLFHQTHRLWQEELRRNGLDSDLLALVGDAEIEAMQRDIRNVQAYIAARVRDETGRDFSQPTISRLLTLIETEAMRDELTHYEYLDDLQDIYTENINALPITQTNIDRVAVTFQRRCAGKGLPPGYVDTTFPKRPKAGHQGCLKTTYEHYPLCKHCLDYYGVNRHDWPMWLSHRAQWAHTERREKARDALMAELRSA